MLYIILAVQVLTLLLVAYVSSVSMKLMGGFGKLNNDQLSSIGKSGVRIEKAAAEVAQDLANAHARADAVGKGQHGEAADAASQQTAKEKRANHSL